MLPRAQLNHCDAQSMKPCDEELQRQVLAACPDIIFHAVEGSRWGQLITAGEQHVNQSRQQPTRSPLRVVFFTSSDCGKVNLEAAQAFASRFPGSLEVVGVATDHAVDSEAKICLKKRFWQSASQPLRLLHEATVIEMALTAGAEVYTGEIKCDGFREILTRWRPDVIISCAFGQKVDASIINFPCLGTYNFHPSDLLNGYGAGTSPWEDMESRGVTQTVWSLHQMVEEIDAGGVLGQSPPFEVADADGMMPVDRMFFMEQFAKQLSWPISRFLSALIVQHQQGRCCAITSLALDQELPTAVLESMLEPLCSEYLAVPPNDRLQMESVFLTETLEHSEWVFPVM